MKKQLFGLISILGIVLTVGFTSCEQVEDPNGNTDVPETVDPYVIKADTVGSGIKLGNDLLVRSWVDVRYIWSDTDQDVEDAEINYIDTTYFRVEVVYNDEMRKIPYDNTTYNKYVSEVNYDDYTVVIVGEHGEDPYRYYAKSEAKFTKDYEKRDFVPNVDRGFNYQPEDEEAYQYGIDYVKTRSSGAIYLDQHSTLLEMGWDRKGGNCLAMQHYFVSYKARFRNEKISFDMPYVEFLDIQGLDQHDFGDIVFAYQQPFFNLTMDVYKQPYTGHFSYVYDEELYKDTFEMEIFSNELINQ